MIEKFQIDLFNSLKVINQLFKMNDVDDMAVMQRKRLNKVVDPYVYLQIVNHNDILPIRNQIQN